MFSWSKKKEPKRRPRPENSEENEFGIKLDKGPSDKQLEAELRALAGVDSFPEEDINVNEGEEDEESELLRLIGGGSRGKKPAKKATSPDVPLGDITADIDVEEGDEDVEVDENDEELLGELLELTQPEDTVEDEPESEPEPDQPQSNGESDTLSILKERLKMYKTAEAKAKENNESSRARRFSRGIKTIEDLLKKAKAGKPVSPNDIPPVIALNLKPAPPPQPEGPPAIDDVNGTENESIENGQNSEDTSNLNIQTSNEPTEPEDVLSTLTERLKLYQTAEARAKESGEGTRARRFNRGIKTLEGLIRQAKAGKPVSPADIPPAVALNLKPAPPPPPPEEQTFDNDEETVEHELGNVDLCESPLEEAVENKEPEPERNIMDVLSERLQIYKSAEAKAKESGEISRARRFGRGIKTIQDLIRQATAGKPIAPDDIPPPIALNLKPAPPVVVRQEEEEPRESAVENVNLVRSSDDSPTKTPLKFMAPDDDDDDDDLDIDDEVIEEMLDLPRTVMEGLEQRVRIYTKLKEKAEAEGNETLVKENTEILRVYHNAIQTYKNGGYVDVLRLPNPKGCPPIPIPFHIP